MRPTVPMTTAAVMLRPPILNRVLSLAVLFSFITVMPVLVLADPPSALPPKERSQSRTMLGVGKADGLSCSLAASVLSSHRKDLQNCWLQNLATYPEPERGAEVVIQIDLDSAGHPQNPLVTQRSAPHEALERCFLESVRTWRFAPPAQGKGRLEIPVRLNVIPGTADESSCGDEPPPEPESPIETSPEKLRQARIDRAADPVLPVELQQQLTCGTYHAKYRICVGKDGTVSSVTPEIAFPGADEQISARLSEWSFQPQEHPVCASLPFSFKLSVSDGICAVQWSAAPAVPSGYLTTAEISTPLPPLPSSVDSLPACQRAHGIYQVCVTETGTVSSSSVVQAMSQQDAEIAAQIRKWRYRPLASPVCFLRHLSWRSPQPCSEDGGSEAATDCRDASRLTVTSGYRKTASGQACMTTLLKAVRVDNKRVTGTDPHLSEKTRANLLRQHIGRVSGKYRLCVDLAGRVEKVDVLRSIPDTDLSILQTMSQWTFRPGPVPRCFSSNLLFVIEPSSVKPDRRQSGDSL
jgi:TonB family protein